MKTKKDKSPRGRLERAITNLNKVQARLVGLDDHLTPSGVGGVLDMIDRGKSAVETALERYNRLTH